MTIDSRTRLTELITTIRSQKSSIENMPDTVQNWCGNLVKAARTGGIVGAVSSLGTTVVVDETVVIPKIWGYRDTINNALRETFAALDGMDPGLEVPVSFLNHADEWRNIMGDIIFAGNAFQEADLKGEWSGDGANRFRAMRDRQTPAFKAMAEMCDEVAKNLQEVAGAELTLYSDLATHGQDLIEKVTSLTGSYIGSVDNFPYGPLSSLADLATAVESISGFILDVTTAAAKSAFENTKAANDIAQAVAAQDAIPNNTWPPGVVEYPGSSNSDRERIQITIGDATTQDGDESDWSLS